MGEFSGIRRNSMISIMQSKTFKKNHERSFSAEVITQSVAELAQDVKDESEDDLTNYLEDN